MSDAGAPREIDLEAGGEDGEQPGQCAVLGIPKRIVNWGAAIPDRI